MPVEEMTVIHAWKPRQGECRPTGPTRMPWRELARFTAVGCANTGVDLVVFYMLAALVPPHFNPLLAGAESVAGWMAGTVVGRRLHSRVTFRRLLPAWGYYPVACLGMALQGTITALFTADFGQWGTMLGKPVGILMASGLTYLGYRGIAQGLDWVSVRPVQWSRLLYQTEKAGSNREGFSSKA